jgi:hypothetical protein
MNEDEYKAKIKELEDEKKELLDIMKKKDTKISKTEADLEAEKERVAKYTGAEKELYEQNKALEDKVLKLESTVDTETKGKMKEALRKYVGDDDGKQNLISEHLDLIKKSSQHSSKTLDEQIALAVKISGVEPIPTPKIPDGQSHNNGNTNTELDARVDKMVSATGNSREQVLEILKNS